MFNDIIFAKSFIEDYDKLPVPAKRRLDRRIMVWAVVGKLPPSVQAHRAERYDANIWILYLTCGGANYRILAEIKEHKLYLYRVGNHREISKELNSAA